MQVTHGAKIGNIDCNLCSNCFILVYFQIRMRWNEEISVQRLFEGIFAGFPPQAPPGLWRLHQILFMLTWCHN
jgi:hypothetical protein